MPIMVYCFFDEDSCDVTFCRNQLGILSVNPNKINLNNNFDDDDPNTVVLIRLASHSKFQKRKVLKKIYVKN